MPFVFVFPLPLPVQSYPILSYPVSLLPAPALNVRIRLSLFLPLLFLPRGALIRLRPDSLPPFLRIAPLSRRLLKLTSVLWHAVLDFNVLIPVLP